MSKSLTILLMAVLIVLACFANGVSAKKSGERVHFAAADTVSQEGVDYDFLWTVEDEDNPGVDLVTNGVISGVTGDTQSGFSFPTPVVPKGTSKKFKVKAKLTPKTDAGSLGSVCIGESEQEITVDGPTDSEIGADQTICETEASTEFARDPSIPDDGQEIDWFVDTIDDAHKVTKNGDNHKADVQVAGKLGAGHHRVKMRIKDASGLGTETVLEKDLHVVHKPQPQITE
jgi:hypothetical protein